MAESDQSPTGEPRPYIPEMPELIGRQAEMAQLDDALSGAEAGHGRLIALSREPGIGKTRTAQELAHAVGDISQATEHFQEALAFCAKAGYQPEYACTCWGYAAALLETGGDGDRVRAKGLLDEALQISTDLGMPPLRLRVEDLMSQTEGLPTPA